MRHPNLQPLIFQWRPIATDSIFVNHFKSMFDKGNLTAAQKRAKTAPRRELQAQTVLDIIKKKYKNNPEKGKTIIAKVYHAPSGRVMEMTTDEPGIQFYSGNFLDGKYETKTGGKNGIRTGFCLETQHFPDSPNQPSFPSTELKPGQKYQSKTIYKFSVKK